MRLLPAVFCLVLAACSGGSVDFTIDNPTKQPLAVTIDATRYDVPAESEKAVSLKPGKHTLEAPLTGKLNFIVYTESGGGLINPTLEPYYILNEVYAVDAKARGDFRPMGGPVYVDGIAVPCPCTMSSELFIRRTWAYGAHEEFADTIVVASDQKGNIKGKLFTKADFVRYYDGHYEGAFFVGKERVVQPPVKPVPYLAPLPDFLDAQAQAASKPIRDLYVVYARASDPAEQQKLLKELNPAITGLMTAVMDKMAKWPPSENQKYNDIVGMVSAGFAVPARVVE